MTPDPRTNQYLAKVKEAEERASQPGKIEDRDVCRQNNWDC
jgi:hypothetical protein